MSTCDFCYIFRKNLEYIKVLLHKPHNESINSADGHLLGNGKAVKILLVIKIRLGIGFTGAGSFIVFVGFFAVA